MRWKLLLLLLFKWCPSDCMLVLLLVMLTIINHHNNNPNLLLEVVLDKALVITKWEKNSEWALSNICSWLVLSWVYNVPPTWKIYTLLEWCWTTPQCSWLFHVDFPLPHVNNQAKNSKIVGSLSPTSTVDRTVNVPPPLQEMVLDKTSLLTLPYLCPPSPCISTRRSDTT